MKCPMCNAPLKKGAKKCPMCGYVLPKEAKK